MASSPDSLRTQPLQQLRVLRWTGTRRYSKVGILQKRRRSLARGEMSTAENRSGGSSPARPAGRKLEFEPQSPGRKMSFDGWHGTPGKLIREPSDPGLNVLRRFAASADSPPFLPNTVSLVLFTFHATCFLIFSPERCLAPHPPP